MSHSVAEPCADEVLQFYLPPENDVDDPVTWFDANSDEDSEVSETDFSTRLLGGVDTKKPESSTSMALTIPICYSAMIPGLFCFMFGAGSVAFGAALIVPVILGVLMAVCTLAGIYKTCGAKWYWIRLCVFCLASVCLLGVMGTLVGVHIARLRALSGEKIFENVNPANAFVGNGIYHFDASTVVDVGNRAPFTNVRDEEFDKTKVGYCVAPVTNTALVPGHSVVYWNINIGNCCSQNSLKCWPGMAKAGDAKSPSWVGEWYGPAAHASGVKRFAQAHNVTVPANAVLIRVLEPNFKTENIKFIAIYTVVPFLLLALLPFARNVGRKKSSDEIPSDVAYEAVPDER